MNRKVLYRIYQAVLLALYIGLMVFFTVECLKTGTESATASGKVANTTANVINTISGEEKVDANSESFQSWVRKFIGHYGFFIVLGLVSSLFYLSLEKIKYWIRPIPHFVVGFLFAVVSEFALEGNTQGRGASWKDVGLDSLGFITLSFFIVLIFLINKIYRIRKNA